MRPDKPRTEALALTANGLRFHALAAGPADGPLVLFLHGFPELARSWRHQLPALGAAGYRAVAPDMRGYGETELRGPYDVGTLVRDATRSSMKINELKYDGIGAFSRSAHDTCRTR